MHHVYYLQTGTTTVREEISTTKQLEDKLEATIEDRRHTTLRKLYIPHSRPSAGGPDVLVSAARNYGRL